MIAFRMPSLGADMEDGTLRAWRVKPGDTVKRGDIVADVETQKGIIEVECFDEGVVHELLVKEDEKVPVDTALALLRGEGEALGPAAPGAAPVKKPVDGRPVEHVARREGPGAPAERVRATPLAKRLAQEQGIDLATLTGTGPDGAISKDDVEQAISARMAPPHAAKDKHHAFVEMISGAPTAPVDAAAGIRQAVAAAMAKSNREIPHYHLEERIDLRAALQWLAEANKARPVKEQLLPAVLLIKATALALRKVPDLNGWWVDGALQRKPEVHLGFVVSLRTGGVVVSAIHRADQLGLDELMRHLNELIPRARALKLRSSELSESTVTLTSLGDRGASVVHGVIYPPQVALVGFGGISEQPWAENGVIDARPVVTATLAADHRANDGATGSRFLRTLSDLLQTPGQL
ncbi:MAG: dihydrolipoamide acetyltransferase family protein [Flavobacteriales bacterium]|nr:MAG: dihydrolipoamide acetyltransferase family protein [Flavobacteriales bacterium]